ncbi:hypothetical protein [Clostridium oceanicum]|uniref:DUF8052 domain-containing protein n=1 Tax=Clostridium oceanicum TaxID=1543 RepID=A0ABP3UU62_9CLOT
MMNPEDYIEKVENSYKTHFQIKKDLNFSRENLDLFAKCKIVNIRSMITEKDIIDSFETNEYCFVKDVESVSEEFLQRFSNMLVKAEDEYVVPHKDHKSSYITGIIVSKTPVDEKMKNYVKKFKFAKAYKFYWYGWCDIRLVLVDLANEQVVTNKAGKIVRKVYQKHFNKN